MKSKQIEYSETSAYKLQTSGNYPEESVQQGQILMPKDRNWQVERLRHISV